MSTGKIKSIGHAAYKCENLEKTVAFYRDVLGCPVKFELTYREWLNYNLQKAEKEGKTMDPEWVGHMKALGDQVWITYIDINGEFIELFYPEGVTEHQLPGRTLNYQHLSLEVDDIHAFTEKIRALGAPIDSEPSLGLEHTWQMWSHDPDGNAIEFMQYTDRSYQLVGKEKSEY